MKVRSGLEVKDRNEGGKRLKQTLIVPLTVNEMMARDLVVDLAREVEEEMSWKIELEEDKDGLIKVAESFERATRKERADRLKFAFHLANGMDVIELAGYESGVATRQALEKETAASKRVDIEMRVVELTVRGLKRKAMRKETSEEKNKYSDASFSNTMGGSTKFLERRDKYQKDFGFDSL